MPERPPALRVLQHHLRHAGSLIAAGELDAASAHIDAALAIDPASPAALTLRDRVRRAAESAAAPNRDRSLIPLIPDSPRPETGQGDPESAEPPRFVPSGVDPRSWMNFESRIEERRFRSLIHAVNQAIARGDGVSARIALEEGRELRPDAPELDTLSEQVALLPTAFPVEVTGTVFRARTLRAASMLLFGVTLVMGLDWLRSDTPSVSDSNAAWERDTPAGLDEPGLATAMRRGSSRGLADLRSGGLAPLGVQRDEAESAPLDPPANTSVSAAARVDEPGASLIAAAPPATEPGPIPTAASEPAAAAPRELSSQPLIRAGEVPDDYVAPSVQRSSVQQPAPQRAPLPATTALPRGSEVPDDYVAPQLQRQRAADAGQAPSATPQASTARATREPLSPTSSARTTTGPPPANRASNARETAGGAASTTAAGAAPASDVSGAASSGNSPVGTAGNAPATARGGAATVTVAPEDEVNGLVTQWARAYGDLDARAARAIWPTVDERELARAFASLESQTLTIDGCDIDVQGDTRATASCRGNARYVVKVGSREPRTEPRSWQIGLKRDGEDWVIDTVRTSR